MTQSATLFSVALNMVLQRTVEEGNIACKFKQICSWSLLTLRLSKKHYWHFKWRQKNGIKKQRKWNIIHANVLYASRKFLQNLTVSELKFEGVDSFTYLVSVVNNENKMGIVISESWEKVAGILKSSGPNYCPEILN